ncbi:MAG: hypothetical protein ACAI25_17080 [Planctomycetota bacterium]
MTKEWDDRLDESLKTIKTTKLTKNEARKVKIAEGMAAWIKASGSFAKTISGWTSLEDAKVAGKTKPIRDQRRAMMLVRLWNRSLVSDAIDPKDVGDAATMTDDKVLAGLDDSLGAAWDEYDKYSAASLDKTFDELKKDPVKWLATNLLTITGEQTAGAGRKHDYAFSYNRQSGVYMLDFNADAAPIQHTMKSAWLIPVSAWSNVKGAVGKLPGTTVAGVDVALTTQFTGCTYCFQISTDKKTLTALHVDPEKKGVSGEDLSKELRKTGVAFAQGNNGTFKAFGRVKDTKADLGYGDGWITIIAIKGSAGWGVYMQAKDAKKKITDHRRIDA